MFKIMIFVFGVLLTGAVSAENLIKSSYGEWYGSDNEISISKKGIDEYAQNKVECGDGNYPFIQKTVSYSGGEIIARINDAIEFGDDSAELKKIKSTIERNKKYQAIDVAPPKCADGSVTFIQLNTNTGLYIESGPDDVFHVLRKH